MLAGAVADMYENWITKGIHICTANKKLPSGPLEKYSVRKMATD